MGVTIHFEGRLRKEKDFESVIAIGRDLAKRVNAEIVNLDSNNKVLNRVRNEQDWDYKGQVKGIQFLPEENCDPIVLEFDKDFYIQEYCKTQFAGISTHILIIQFLRDITPYFDNLIVVDEGEFWETSDIKVLEEKFEDFFRAAENAVKENPKLKGPFRLGNGRIVDLME
jgi:hypothetical protein